MCAAIRRPTVERVDPGALVCWIRVLRQNRIIAPDDDASASARCGAPAMRDVRATVGHVTRSARVGRGSAICEVGLVRRCTAAALICALAIGTSRRFRFAIGRGRLDDLAYAARIPTEEPVGATGSPSARLANTCPALAAWDEENCDQTKRDDAEEPRCSVSCAPLFVNIPHATFARIARRARRTGHRVFIEQWRCQFPTGREREPRKHARSSRFSEPVVADRSSASPHGSGRRACCESEFGLQAKKPFHY